MLIRSLVSSDVVKEALLVEGILLAEDDEHFADVEVLGTAVPVGGQIVLSVPLSIDEGIDLHEVVRRRMDSATHVLNPDEAVLQPHLSVAVVSGFSESLGLASGLKNVLLLANLEVFSDVQGLEVAVHVEGQVV